MVIWMDLSQQGADGCFILAMWRNIQNSSCTLTLLSALCSVSPAPEHHWDSPQLPVVLTGTLAAKYHIGQLEKLLLRLQPIGLVLHFLAR